MEENGICSAAFCESAALRAGACSPERADFPRPGEDVTAGDKKGNLSSKCETERASPFAEDDFYSLYCRIAPPHVRPPPKPMHAIVCPGCSCPVSASSFRATGMLAALVLPWRSMFL